MTLPVDAPSAPAPAPASNVPGRGSGARDARRNFILQQGLCEPAAGTCPRLYSALLLQPRVVGLWVVVGTILQAPVVFFALGAVLWFGALAPRLNPFDAVYNRMLGRARGMMLTAAPAPRRFAQVVAGSFAAGIGISLVLGWRLTAFVLEGFFIAAIAALVLGGFCLGSFVYHVVCGRGGFARRTLPWGRGE